MTQLFTNFIYHQEQAVQQQIESAVEAVDENVIADADSAEYAATIVAPHKLTSIDINWDRLRPQGHREEKFFERNMFGEEVRNIRIYYKFSVPYVGDPSLFHLHTDYSVSLHDDFTYNDSHLSFELIDRGSDASNQAKLKQVKDGVETNISRLNHSVDSYNESLQAHAQKLIEARQERIQKNRKGFESFGFPKQADELVD